MRFRKKPVEIEAVQFLDSATAPKGVFVEEDGRCYVVTVHPQRCYLQPGDWIIPEPDGEHFYPCRPDIFEATYESVYPPEAPSLEEWALDTLAEAYHAFYDDRVSAPFDLNMGKFWSDDSRSDRDILRDIFARAIS